MYKVLIADDERIARGIIDLLLAEQRDIGEVLQAKNGNQAAAMIEQHQPDLVFLDIQMPGLLGTQIAASVPAHTVVIFVTAYDEYAVEAFELHAIDYLLKPFEDARFYQALDRARRQLAEAQQRDYQQISQLLDHALHGEGKNKGFKQRLAVKEPGRIRLIEVEQINYILGAGNYAEVHLFGGGSILHRETLSCLEEQLDPELFVRIHRSSIVRRSAICELRPNEKGDYQVLLKNGDSLTLSRRNKHKLAELIE